MTKILFIIGTLDSGGVAKSIVNLLNAIDREGREVHLQVMSQEHGPYERYIPEDVIEHRNSVTGWLLNGFSGVRQLLRHGQVLLALGSLLRMALSRIDKPLAGWLLAQLYPKLEGEWDVIVDYNGQQDLYYMVDKLKAKRKVTFFHNDYYKWRYYERMDRHYFKKVNNIFSISEQCVKSLKEIFPEVEDKIGLIYNISLPDMIYKMAEDLVDIPEHKGALLVTVGHVCERKGIDFAIEAAKIMSDKSIDFLWMWVGANDDPKYNKSVCELGLEGKFMFCGVCPNPYPYMQRADIIVHPSRFEGKSITLDEAKILCKPIVVTRFSTVEDQFEDGVNALICEMNSQSVAEGIQRLIEDSFLCQQMAQTLTGGMRNYGVKVDLANYLY